MMVSFHPLDCVIIASKTVLFVFIRLNQTFLSKGYLSAISINENGLGMGFYADYNNGTRQMYDIYHQNGFTHQKRNIFFKLIFSHQKRSKWWSFPEMSISNRLLHWVFSHTKLPNLYHFIDSKIKDKWKKCDWKSKS